MREHGIRFDTPSAFFTTLVVLLCTSLSTACDSATEPRGPVVEIAPDARRLVEEIVTDAATVTGHAARLSDGLSPPHLGFGGWLVARPETYLAHVSLATTAPGEYEPYCSGDGPGPDEPDFWAEHDACSRLRIQEAFYMDVYFTERSHRLPGDRHEMRYPASGGTEGTVVYSENPLFTWRYGFEPDEPVTVRSDIDVRARVEPETGAPLVADHTGSLRGRSDPRGGGLSTIRVELDFPALTDCPSPLHVVLDDDGEAVGGSVTCEGRTVAEIRHPGETFAFDWLGG